MPGQGVVQGSGEAVDVAQEGISLLPHSFRRDVVGRAEDRGIGIGVGIGLLGQTEVHHLGFTVGAEEDVAWLDVEVQQTPLEGRLQGASHLDSDVQHVELRKGFLRLDPAVQTPSISNLHRQEP